MPRAKNRTGQPPRRAAHVAAAAIGVATCAIVWWLLKPSAAAPHDLAAMVRERGLFDDAQPGEQELVLARLLGAENLTASMRESRFAVDADAADRDLVADVRSRLRIDVGQTDGAGMRAVTVRWTGTGSPAAARLLNVLAHRLLKHGEGVEVTANGPMDDNYHRPPGRRGQLEMAHAAASDAAREAEQALSLARQRFEAALSDARVAEHAAATASPSTDVPGEPTLAPPLDTARDSWFLFRQQLADLENRRQELSERLMPEHPEMKALNEKIQSLQSRLARQPPAPVVTAPPPSARHRAPPQGEGTRQAVAQVTAFGEELTAAQAEYASAINRERAAWQALHTAKTRSAAEMQPAKFTPTPASHPWPRAFIASFCGILSGAFAALAWPARRLTFGTVEEVRAVTRLPVIALSRHSLN